MTNIPEAAIAAAKQTIITTRDFCGNERAAAMDTLADHGIKGEAAQKAFRIANFRANQAWNGFQKAAGVPGKYTF